MHEALRIHEQYFLLLLIIFFAYPSVCIYVCLSVVTNCLLSAYSSWQHLLSYTTITSVTCEWVNSVVHVGLDAGKVGGGVLSQLILLQHVDFKVSSLKQSIYNLRSIVNISYIMYIVAFYV